MGSLNVKIVGSSGNGRKGVRVSGEVAGFIGSMTSPERTDADGHACISWGSGNSLEKIFVDGKAQKGPFRSGGTYSFRV